MLTGHWFGMEHYDSRPLDGKFWQIENPDGAWGFELDSVGFRGCRIVPRDAAIFDYASIPYSGILWKLVGPPTGFGKGRAYGPAAAIHDELMDLGYMMRPIPGEPGRYAKFDIGFRLSWEIFDACLRAQLSRRVEGWLEQKWVSRVFWLVKVTPWRRRLMVRAVKGRIARRIWKRKKHPVQ